MGAPRGGVGARSRGRDRAWGLMRGSGRIMLRGMMTTRREKQEPPISAENVHAFLDELFGQDMHAKRVRSIADTTTGVLQAGELGIHAIGRGIASAKGLADKHAIKQVDRCIGNEKIDVDKMFERCVPHCIADDDEIWVNMDWTEFDADDHSMLVLSLQTSHGRATPLMWKTVVKSKLKGQRNNHEDALLQRLRDLVPREVRVVIVADRGFGDQKLFAFLSRELRFDFIIRIRGDILVSNDRDEQRPAAKWVGKGGRMRRLRRAWVTGDETPVGLFVAVQDKKMKDAWCLVASDPSWSGSFVKKRYGKRFSCEETFRDLKDLRYGLGMSWRRISKPGRRDRMMMVASLAHVLLSLLGAAGEAAGLDRLLKANTSKKRTLSLFRQGLRWFELIPNMPASRLRKLLVEFDRIVRQHELFAGLLASNPR